MEDVEDLLLQIEEELDNGKRNFFGSGVTVDGDAIYALIDRIRNNLPDAIREAKYVIANTERRRHEDTVKAQNIVLAAQQRADQILSEHNIIYQAEREAEAIRNQAAEYRLRILTEVKEDINAMLTDAERNLSDSLASILDAKKKNNMNNY